MTTSLLLLADTHVPLRGKDLPVDVWHAVNAADVVVHAGDWVDLATFEALEARSRRLVAVYGNNDGPDLRARMPEIARARIEDVEVAVIHETGAASGREKRMDGLFSGARPDLLVFGHSHIPWDSTTPGGIRLLNPGSPTDRRRQPVCTMMTATVDGAELRDVTLHPVERVFDS